MSAPLHHAVEHGHIEAVVMLIGNGANVNVEDEDDRTPHFYAWLYGYDDIMDILDKNGALHGAYNPMVYAFGKRQMLYAR